MVVCGGECCDDAEGSVVMVMPIILNQWRQAVSRT